MANPRGLGQPVRWRSHTRLDPEAAHILNEARVAMGSARNWHELQQLTDGIGNFMVVHSDLERLHALRGQTSEGAGPGIIGSTRYVVSNSSAWGRQSLHPLGTTLLQDGEARSAIRGRRARCGTENCIVVLWASSDRTTEFTAWICLNTHRVFKLLMLAPARYMTMRITNVDSPAHISPPK